MFDSGDGTQVFRLDGFRLALDVEGFDGFRLERRRRMFQNLGGDQDLAFGRPRHDSGRQIHRVADDGVRPPERSTHIPGEDVSAVHADT